VSKSSLVESAERIVVARMAAALISASLWAFHRLHRS
jgi:hypothetical protein